MKQLLLPLFILCTVGMACETSSTHSQADSPRAKHLLFIGIDGLSPEGIQQAQTPNIDQMINNGASTMHARSVFMTSSSPNWAAMINGVGPEQSGITTNAWGRDNYILPATNLGVEKIFPTIFSIVRDQLPQANIACIYHWTGLGRLLETSVMDYHKTWDTEKETTADVVRYIREAKPNFLFVHLDHVDGVGHKAGHGTVPYFASVELADSLVGAMIQAYKDAEIYEETVVMLSSDHGGINFGHGGETAEETAIPFIIYGKGVKQGHQIFLPVNQYDNPATALFAMGLDQPDVWIGRAIKSAFEGNSEGYRGYRHLAAIPQVYPDGGVFETDIPLVECRTLTEDGVMRFTLDGTEPNETSPEYTSPISLSANTVFKVKTFKGDQISQTREAHFVLLDASNKNGVLLEYWPHNRAQSFGPKATGPSFVDTVMSLDLQGLSMIKGDVRYTYSTWLQIDQQGSYRFELLADSPADFSIGKQSGKTSGHYMSAKEELELVLPTGRHLIQLNYQPDAYGRSLQVYYIGPGIDRQKIPATKLFLEKGE